MKSIRILTACVSLMLSSSLTLHAADPRTLQIKGSDTMVNLGQAWAEEFMHRHPEANIAVTGGGSGTGIAAIIAGTCDIAQSSRAMKAEEIAKAEAQGGKVKETIVAYDGIAVIVHPSNPVSELTLDQLSDIFTGKSTNWKEVGGADQSILVLSRERNSGTHVYFLEEVVRKGNAKGPEEYAPSVLMMPSSQSIVQEVQNSDAAIGYVGLGYVTGQQKVLGIAKDSAGLYVKPSLETVQSGAYPISRSLLFYTRQDQENVLQTFMEFVLSPEGQEIVKILDFIPLES